MVHSLKINPSLFTSGKTEDGNPYHQRYINATQVLAQRNRAGVWCGYVGQLFKTDFTDENAAIDWLVSFPLAALS